MIPQRHAITAYAGIDSLVDCVCKAIENMRPGEVGTWYAERLERAAKIIREKNEEAK